MARITVERCLRQPGMGNAFDLVLTATKRARQLVRGGDSFVAVEDDKPTVIALREVEAGQVTTDSVEEHFDFGQDLLSQFSGLKEQPPVTPIGFDDEEDEVEADTAEALSDATPDSSVADAVDSVANDTDDEASDSAEAGQTKSESTPAGD